MDPVTRTTTARYSQIAMARSTAAPPSSPVSTGPDGSAVGRVAGTVSGIDTVETSGRAIMISRIFAAVPETVFSTAGDPAASGSIYSYLTREDRDAVARVYETARDNGSDLRQVDAIAFDLAVYRSSRPEIVHGMPVRYDADGTPRPAAFSPDDEAAAQRLLTSKALTTSALPADFLRARLDPALSEGHAADLSFLEQVVYATSRDGAAHDPNARVPPRPSDYFADALAASAPTVAASTPAGGDIANGRDHVVATTAHALLALSSKNVDSISAIVAQWYSGSNSRHTPHLPRLSEALVNLRRMDTL